MSGAARVGTGRSPFGARGPGTPRGWRERYPGFRLRLTRWGAVYLVLLLVVGAAAVNTGNNALMMVLGLAVGSYVVAGAWSRQVLGGVVVDVDRPREAFAGRPAAFAVTLANTSRLPGYGLVLRDRRGRALLVEPYLEGRGSVRHGVELTLPRRGWSAVGPWRLDVLLPLGFFVKSKSVDVGGALLVYPRLARGATTAASEGLDGTSDARVRDRGREGEVTQLRGFRPGDEHRQVHWKQTARQQRMIVTDRQHHREGAVWLSLDTRLRGPHDAAVLERFEASVSAVAEETVRRLHGGETVGLALGGRRYGPVTSAARARALLRPLAELVPERQHRETAR